MVQHQMDQVEVQHLGAGPQPDPSGAEPSADNTKDEKVVDAEFEEVDEDKKD